MDSNTTNIGALIDELRRPMGHEDCDDCWYSCATLTCDETRKSDVCDCGRDNLYALHMRAADALSVAQSSISALTAEIEHYADLAEERLHGRSG